VPKRPRSHQIETLSEERFRSIVPKQWVVRRKDQDYGIDLEVEIFDQENEATGLLFFVQLRATDNTNLSKKTVLTRDQQEYFSKLQLPTILFRYCTADASSHWRWNYTLPDLKDGSKSHTILFSDDDQWSDRTPNQIEEALRLWRSVKRQPVDRPISLHFEGILLPPPLRQPIRSAVRQLVEGVAALRWEDEATDEVILTVSATTGTVTVSLGKVATLTGPYNELDIPAFKSQLLYMVTAVLDRLGLHRHADLAARCCLAAQIPAPTAELAHRVCYALKSNAVQAASLAILNGLHDFRRADGAFFLGHLSRQPFDVADRDEAFRLFIHATRESAHAAGDEASEGSAWYSLGNHHAMRREPALAFAAFNRARKLRKQYMTTPYFLSEVGGVLFGAGHFQASANFYTRSADLEANQRLSLHLGDALLMSGQFQKATARYCEALAGGDPAIVAEADLKGEVALWLLTKHGVVSRLQTSKARSISTAPDAPSHHRRILGKIDAMDTNAHWNLGVCLARGKKYPEALRHFLVCAFQRSGDQEAWTNALLCALNSQNPPMLQRVLRCALVLGGPYAADSFCARMSNAGEITSLLTSVIAEFSTELSVGRPPATTIRILKRDR
jgi:tetratricopeptide (TPR) repeat protein